MILCKLDVLFFPNRVRCALWALDCIGVSDCRPILDGKKAGIRDIELRFLWAGGRRRSKVRHVNPEVGIRQFFHHVETTFCK